MNKRFHGEPGWTASFGGTCAQIEYGEAENITPREPASQAGDYVGPADLRRPSERGRGGNFVPKRQREGGKNPHATRDASIHFLHRNDRYGETTQRSGGTGNRFRAP